MEGNQKNPWPGISKVSKSQPAARVWSRMRAFALHRSASLAREYATFVRLWVSDSPLCAATNFLSLRKSAWGHPPLFCVACGGVPFRFWWRGVVRSSFGLVAFLGGPPRFSRREVAGSLPGPRRPGEVSARPQRPWPRVFIGFPRYRVSVNSPCVSRSPATLVANQLSRDNLSASVRYLGRGRPTNYALSR